MAPITITPASLTDLPTLIPFLAHSSTTNLFTRSLLTPSSLLNRAAYVILATWLYTAALNDPKARILIAQDYASQNDDDQKREDQSNEDHEKETKIVGCVWLQYFDSGETWKGRYKLRFRKGTKNAPPDCVDTDSYARALKRLQEHREASMQGRAHTYIRALSLAPSSGLKHEEIFLTLLTHLEEISTSPVIFQHSPFLPAAVFSEIVHRWRMAPTLLGAHGEKRFSVGRGWQGWIFEGRGRAGEERGGDEVEGNEDTVMEGGDGGEEMGMVREGIGRRVEGKKSKAKLRLIMRERGH
ncbi:hypothetical protein N7G274_000907 [Stereocaulon virgatum]|uniref:Uncharacterized protein n=1 Tax=Stereocaulon virgatum TaxID=373712 RepID=A0ABR4AMC2_9LECA